MRDVVPEEVKPTSTAVMPGKQLRMAREARGMSLDEAARVTCIGKSYLEALESDRYEQLPNPAYVKGIIRSYAQAVGIPPDPLIAGYEQGAAPDETADERIGGRALPPGRKQWLLLLILGLVICAGYMLAQRDGGTGRPLPSGGETMSAAVPATGVMPPRTSHTRTVPTPAAPVVPAVVPPSEEHRAVQSPVPDPRKAVLKVRVLEECLLTITIDDAPPQQYDLKPSDQVEWMGERFFVLEMTNSGAIEAELNGKPLPLLGKSGDAATVVVTADGQIE